LGTERQRRPHRGRGQGGCRHAFRSRRNLRGEEGGGKRGAARQRRKGGGGGNPRPPPSDSNRTDDEIAAAALSRLAWDVVIPKDAITVKVEKGWVT
jgi:hypothetical protein